MTLVTHPIQERGPGCTGELEGFEAGIPEDLQGAGNPLPATIQGCSHSSPLQCRAGGRAIPWRSKPGSGSPAGAWLLCWSCLTGFPGLRAAGIPLEYPTASPPLETTGSPPGAGKDPELQQCGETHTALDIYLAPVSSSPGPRASRGLGKSGDTFGKPRSFPEV